jgi:GNAT superfamily N-acetyltransferase
MANSDLRDLTIRRIASGDSVVMAKAFSTLGPSKSIDQFERYLREQNEGRREVLLALVAGESAGYVTVNWHPSYAPLAAAGIPELQDLNVLPSFRRRGIATHLVDHAEEIVSARCGQVGIAVGLHPGYNAAQRMYVSRGYVPDGHGVTVRDEFVREGQTVVMDDDLVLHLLKRLPPDTRAG